MVGTEADSGSTRGSISKQLLNMFVRTNKIKIIFLQLFMIYVSFPNTNLVFLEDQIILIVHSTCFILEWLFTAVKGNFKYR